MQKNYIKKETALRSVVSSFWVYLPNIYKILLVMGKDSKTPTPPMNPPAWNPTPGYEKKLRMTPIKSKLKDILLMVTWGRISKDYFKRSGSWIYNKMNGIDGNGGEGGFTPEELQQLKGALCDLADRIRRAADTL